MAHKKTKLWFILGTIIASFFVLSALAFIVYKVSLDPCRRTIEDDSELSVEMKQMISPYDAVEDLDYFYNIVKNRHPAWIDGSSDKTKEFNTQYTKYRELYTQYINQNVEIPARKLYFDIKSIGNCLADSHTLVYSTSQEEEVTEDYHFEDLGNWVYFSLNLDKDYGILVLKECTYDELYQETIQAFFEHIYHYNIKNIIIDLRGNKGGSSQVATEFIKYLGNVNSYKTIGSITRIGAFTKKNNIASVNNKKNTPAFYGNVYVLTDSKTVGSAMLFAQLIQDNNIGRIVGFPSSNKPEYYGDELLFKLPNTHFYFTCSYKKYLRIDQNKKDLYLIPDYQCLGDEALDEAIKLINHK